MRKTASFPFYPLLLAVYPALALLAYNIAQVRPVVAVRSLAVCLLAGALLYALLWRLLRGDTQRAAALTALVLVLFFTYGHVYQLIEGRTLFGLRIGRHALLVPLWLVLLAFGARELLRRPAALPAFNRIFGTVSLALVVLALAQLGIFAVKVWQYSRQGASTAPTAAPALSSGSDRPDVYYIILDGYTRSDALKEKYGFDNSDFLRQLEALGFVIPACTQSNYAYTVLSLSSAFNMDYLENFSTLIQQGDTDRDWVAYQEFIRDNAVRRNFKQLGYKLVAFETGYWWGEVTDADYYIVANDNPLAKYGSGYEINSFEVLFLRTTALRVLSEASTRLLSTVAKDIRTPEQKHFDRVNFSLDQLGQIPALPGSKFVFAHIIAPHPPFVFTENGEFRNLSWKSEGYAPEVAYLNGRVLAAVRQILANSKTPPVIIIQGDHGWDADNRMKILNAYYLPGGADRLYPQITPVNTFRLVFDQYFGGSYDFIPDVSRYSFEDSIYKFTVVPPTCVAGQK